MSKKKNKGYILPKNLEPADDVCFVVRVPNEVEYIRAFFGAYTSFGQWIVWERTGNASGAIAAQRWKQSIIKSLHKKICCDLVDCLDDEGNMCINLNVDCGCGSGGGGNFEFTINGGGCLPIAPDEVLRSDDIEDTPTDVIQPLDPTGNVPDTLANNGVSDWSDYDIYICDLAYHLVKIVAAGLRELETQIDRLLTLAGVSAIVAYLTPAGWGAAVGTVAFSELMAAIVELLGIEDIADSLGQLADEIESPTTKQEIICALFENRYLLPTAHSEFLLRMQQAVTDLVFSAETEAALLRFIEAWFPLRYLFKGLIEAFIQPIETGQDCTACGNQPTYYDLSRLWDYANTAAPWVGTTGVQTHLTPFYSEGHVALISAGGVEATITLSAEDLLAEFPPQTYQTVILKKVKILAARAVTEHSNVPYQGSMRVRIYNSGVAAVDETKGYSLMQDDAYTVFEWLGNWSISATGTDPVVQIGSIAGGAFQSELKIGEVILYLDYI